jgi:hypothetical protein
MATVNDPNTPTEIARVGAPDTTTSQAPLHTIPRPISHGNLGHYRWAGITGILPAALGANSEIFQFRWSHASILAIITEIRIAAAVSTTMFAAGVPVQIDLIKSTGWSAQGTGGTAVTMGALGKMRNGFASSSMVAGDMRIATTAALGAGTKTLETGVPIAAIAAAGPITGSLVGTIIPPGTPLLLPDSANGEHPLVLGVAGGGANSMGFSIRSVAVPATGTWSLSVSIQWAEVSAY